jgi:pyruvate formate lyase activating enzyme
MGRQIQSKNLVISLDIRGFVDTSLVDWKGKVVSTVFTPGCNFKCPFCFNVDLVYNFNKLDIIPEEKVIEFLKKNSKFIDGVAVIGGEPTLQNDLPEFCRKIKNLKLKVRIFTNGTDSEMIKKLIDEKLIDSVAMDVKAPLEKEKYDKLAGVSVDLNEIKKSISIIKESGIDYEFITTVIPTLLSEKDIEGIAKYLNDSEKYVLHRFLPENACDKRLRNLKIQTDEEMEKLVSKAKKYIKNVRWQ